MTRRAMPGARTLDVTARTGGDRIDAFFRRFIIHHDRPG